MFQASVKNANLCIWCAALFWSTTRVDHKYVHVTTASLWISANPDDFMNKPIEARAIFFLYVIDHSCACSKYTSYYRRNVVMQNIHWMVGNQKIFLLCGILCRIILNGALLICVGCQQHAPRRRDTIRGDSRQASKDIHPSNRIQYSFDCSARRLFIWAISDYWIQVCTSAPSCLAKNVWTYDSTVNLL